MRPTLQLVAMAFAAAAATAPVRMTAYPLRITRVWHADGSLAEERTWRGTREDGVHRGWWSNGNQRFEYTYRDGVLQGASREWFMDGAIWREQQYVAGHEAGLQRMYWQDGRVRASYEVRNGRRYGLLGAKGCVTKDSATTEAPL